MINFWNERYAQPEYIYGKAPNVFFAEQIGKLSEGNLLLPAEGEGRNAVYAAQKGWKVTAFDSSDEAKKKALALVRTSDVQINYQLANADEFDSDGSFDVVALIYAHFAGDERSRLFRKVQELMKPGGHLLMEVFSKNQLGKSSGGPKVAELLYNEEEIRSSFPSIEFIMLEESNVLLDEGAYHQGEASVIRAVGQKK